MSYLSEFSFKPQNNKLLYSNGKQQLPFVLTVKKYNDQFQPVPLSKAELDSVVIYDISSDINAAPVGCILTQVKDNKYEQGKWSGDNRYQTLMENVADETQLGTDSNYYTFYLTSTQASPGLQLAAKIRLDESDPEGGHPDNTYRTTEAEISTEGFQTVEIQCVTPYVVDVAMMSNNTSTPEEGDKEETWRKEGAGNSYAEVETYYWRFPEDLHIIDTPVMKKTDGYSENEYGIIYLDSQYGSYTFTYIKSSITQAEVEGLFTLPISIGETLTFRQGTNTPDWIRITRATTDIFSKSGQIYGSTTYAFNDNYGCTHEYVLTHSDDFVAAQLRNA
ncbi:hypothetical protein [Edaphovirga cremea]|uniref:hypothetical protein n=1 Tax=Edaphovirga cremea TaxID=2267246 RepID=UPI000DEF11C3|nr:hypothetical protein [Edaphovirga cremea]